MCKAKAEEGEMGVVRCCCWQMRGETDAGRIESLVHKCIQEIGKRDPTHLKSYRTGQIDISRERFS